MLQGDCYDVARWCYGVCLVVKMVLLGVAMVFARWLLWCC